MINRQRLLKDFFDLVQIRSSTKNERHIADILAKRLADLGCSVSEDDAGKKIGGNAGNLFGYLRGSVPDAPRLMLSAHMDTVEPSENIKPRLEKGVITAEGPTILGADCKAGLAAILEAVLCARESGLEHGDIQLVITVAEEGGVNGSKNMDPSRLQADLGYVFDTNGSPGKVVVSAPGKNRIDVTIQGKKAHAGICPEEGINAIMGAAKALAHLPMGRIDQETTANVGVITGGTSTNVVPDTAQFCIETRSRDKAKLDALTDEIISGIEKGAASCGARAAVRMQPDYAPYSLAQDAPQIRLVAQAMGAIGLTPRFEGTGGGSDANFFNSYGVPTAVLATGMTKAHTVEECILEEDLYKTGELALAIIKAAARTKKSS